jgi:DNA-binding CsgD family transcriptional regulator
VEGTVDLAGRVGELRAVSALLAGDPAGAAMLVVGEAGVGKSRLVAAAADSVARADVVVVSGWCLPLSEGVPFLPVMDLLGTVGKLNEARLLKDALAGCPAFVRAEVARLLPELEEPTSQQWSGGSDEGWRKQQLFESLRRLFEALAAEHKLAVVVEDVHWADTSTVELLDYLLAPGHALSVPVVLTCRGEEPITSIVSGWLDRLQRNPRVRRVDLAPLSEAETGEQIELLLGAPPTRALVADTYARSEGNAFFVEQLVAAGAVGRDLPAGLTSLLLSRTRQVTGICRHVLAVLAVAARPLDEATVVRLCQRSDSEVREALRDLLARRLLRRPDAAGRHQLRHALLGEAISGELLPGERAELHARVADTLAGWHDRSLAAQIAEHLAAAGRVEEELSWRVRAGRHADAVFASAEAARQWQRAVALCADAAITLSVEGMALSDLYWAAEDALLLSGNQDAARELAEEALQRLAGADPASRADVLERAGEIRSLSAPQQGLELLNQAIAIYERLPPSAGHVKALHAIYGILHNEGRLTEAAEATARAAVVAEHAGERAALLEILAVQAWDEMAAGEGEPAAERMRVLRQRLTDRDEPRVHVFLAVVHTDMLLKLGRITEVEAAGAAALQAAVIYGIEQSYEAAGLRANVCEALTELGAIDAAGYRIGRESSKTPNISSRPIYELRAILEMLRGNLDDAHQRWSDLHRLAPTRLGLQVENEAGEIELELWLGLPDVAFGHAHSLLVRLAQANHGTLAGPLITFAGPLLILAQRACADLAEQARVDHDADAVNSAHENADQLVELHHGLTPDPFTEGPLRPTSIADHASWNAEWSRLRGASDPALWEQAANEWDALTRPHRAAYARWRQAEALLAQHNGRTNARVALQTAARQAAQHVPLSDAILDLARRARIDLASTTEHPAHHPPIATATPFGLTDRELAVLKLLAQGKTNSEIGAALFISRKTASVHVTNILRKLDVATRVQAATVAERAGLLPAE